MKVILQTDLVESGRSWNTSLLELPVGGLPLLQRHLITYRRLGLDKVFVQIARGDETVREIVERCAIEGMRIEIVEGPEKVSEEESGWRLVHRADTVLDPKLLKQVQRILESGEKSSFACVDAFPDNYDPEEKSPYKVGTPTAEEAVIREKETTETAETESVLHPVGLKVLRNGVFQEPTRLLLLGRYYWHRVESRSDGRLATRKILLATMKATDGMFARTNRRLSLLISRALINTPVTANMVTVVTFFISLGSGFLFAIGSYPVMVSGAFISWFASMLDGVDGEIARTKFQESDFGCWMEMVCDYCYYVFVFGGVGIGLARQTGNWIWLAMGIGSVFGVLMSFWAIARQRRIYARQGGVSDYGRAWQERVGAQKQNKLYQVMRAICFLPTRAALPYFIFILTAIGLAKLLLFFFFIGTNLTWTLVGYSDRLFRPSQGRMADAEDSP
jgi:phosphatidylglycerophosphate synthase